jgi:hypothetical protein
MHSKSKVELSASWCSRSMPSGIVWPRPPSSWPRCWYRAPNRSAFADIPAPPGFLSDQIHVGKRYGELRAETEVDGLKEAQRIGRTTFYLIILDIAPNEILRTLKPPGTTLADARGTKRRGFAAKWLTAYWFRRYKNVVTPLRSVLHDIPDVDAHAVAANMGWLTWSDVFKTPRLVHRLYHREQNPYRRILDSVLRCLYLDSRHHYRCIQDKFSL